MLKYETTGFFEVLPLGDQAIHVQFGEGINERVFQQVRTLCEQVQQARNPHIIEFVPGYHSVTLHYTNNATYAEISEWVHSLLSQEATGKLPGAINEGKLWSGGRLIEIPVCYGGEFGPDLAFVAEHHSLRPDEVVQIHSKNEYVVYMLGFMPGFPYMGELDPVLATPRLNKPRVMVPKGSVGIAGGQTGIYPYDSPGGWQLIGRTPVNLFRAELDPPAFLHSGDRVRFIPISKEEFERLQVKSK